MPLCPVLRTHASHTSHTVPAEPSVATTRQFHCLLGPTLALLIVTLVLLRRRGLG